MNKKVILIALVAVALAAALFLLAPPGLLF